VPRKIAHILTTAERGGAQLSTMRLVRELARRAGDPLYLVYGEPGPLERAFSELAGVRVVPCPALVRKVRPFSDVVALWRLFRFLRRERIDLVHTHSTKASILGRTAALFSGAKSVHTYHGFGHDYFQNRVLSKIVLRIEAFLNRRSRALVFVCRENFRRAGRLGLLRARAHFVIPDCLDLERLPPREKGRESGPPAVVAVSSFKEQKKPFDLLRIFRAIQDGFPECEFRLAGTGPLWNAAREHASRLGLRRVRFEGAVDDMPGFYRNADCLVGCSRYEGLSMAQMECLYLNIPLVVTRTGGIGDLIEPGRQGFFFDPDDPAGAVDCVARVLDGRFRYARLPEGFWKKYRTGTVVSKMLRAYAFVLAGH
jgi:glycosyltransferase involved in cell wall biosynthesis